MPSPGIRPGRMSAEWHSEALGLSSIPILNALVAAMMRVPGGEACEVSRQSNIFWGSSAARLAPADIGQRPLEHKTTTTPGLTMTRVALKTTATASVNKYMDMRQYMLAHELYQPLTVLFRAKTRHQEQRMSFFPGQDLSIQLFSKALE